MKLKLTLEELQILCRTLLSGADKINWLTKYECQAGSFILQGITNQLVERAFHQKDKYNVKLSKIQVITLNEVLTQLPTEGPFEKVVMYEIIQKINIQCLSF